MSVSHWHKVYTTDVAASTTGLFGRIADMPSYGRWLPVSNAFGETTDVEPYPVRLGSRYRDGKPGEPGKEWWGEVTGFQPPGSLDFHHIISVRQLRATVDTHIHYSIEPLGTRTRVSRWLVLTIAMPLVFRPLRLLVIRAFDTENLRTMAALAEYTETHADELTDE